MPEASARAIPPEAPAARAGSRNAGEIASACVEIRTSLTVMFAAYQLAKHADARVSRHEKRHLLHRAEHHADRAGSLLQETFLALEQS